MATKPTYKAEKPAIRKESKDYIVKRVNGLEEELKRHEKMDLLKAHPLPNMRSEWNKIILKLW